MLVNLPEKCCEMNEVQQCQEYRAKGNVIIDVVTNTINRQESQSHQLYGAYWTAADTFT